MPNRPRLSPAANCTSSCTARSCAAGSSSCGPATTSGCSCTSGTGSPSNDDELRERDELPAAGTWHVFGRALRVTNLDKVLFPPRAGEPPVTKREVLRYAAHIAPTVLPYLTRRALNLHRFPGGADTK